MLLHKPGLPGIDLRQASVLRKLASNTPMDMPDRIERRLTELEIKASYAEDLLDELNRLVARQQAQIEGLLRELAGLRQQLVSGDAGEFRSLRDELPPHY